MLDPLALMAAHDDQLASFLFGDLCNLVMNLAFFEPRLYKHPFGPCHFPDLGNRTTSTSVQNIADIPDSGEIQVPIILGDDLDDRNTAGFITQEFQALHEDIHGTVYCNKDISITFHTLHLTTSMGQDA